MFISAFLEEVTILHLLTAPVSNHIIIKSYSLSCTAPVDVDVTLCQQLEKHNDSFSCIKKNAAVLLFDVVQH